MSRFRQTTRLPIFLLLTAISPSAWPALDVQLTGVDGEAAENLVASLSLFRYRDKDLDELALQRLVDRTPEETVNALQPFGFYHSETAVNVEAAADTTRVSIEVQPGPRSTWRTVAVQIQGEGAGESALSRAVAEHSPVSGGFVDHRQYDNVKANLESAAISAGFLDWRWSVNRLAVHPDVNKADALLVMETGPRYRFGEVDLQQQAVDQDVAQRLLRFRPGDVYSERALLNTQYALLDSQYFSIARVLPGTPDNIAKTVPVSIETTPQNRRRTSFGIGYGTDTRLRGSSTWRWRRLNGRGHRAQIRLAAATTRTELGVRYEIPGRDPVSEQLRLFSNYIDEELADTDSRRINAGVARTRQLWGWRTQTFAEVLREETSIPGEAPDIDTLVIPGISVDRWVRDRTINPRRGYRLTGELRGSQQALLSDTDFLRLDLTAKWLRSFGSNYQLSARLRVGTAWVEIFDNLPASQRFFAGGDQSVRGFGFNELSPRNDLGEIVGGQHLIVGSVELERFIKGPWGVALFTDGGGALKNFNDPLEYSVGIGVRWETPVGKVKLDIAKAVTGGDLSPRFHISIQPSL